MATHEELVEAIRAYAKEHGITPDKVGRDAFKRATAIGKSDHANTGSNWSKAKTDAIGGPDAPDVPPVEVLPPRHRIKGVSTYVGPDGEVKGQWIKTDSKAETQEEVLVRLMAELPQRVAPREGYIERKPGFLSDELLAVYPMGDPHIGMLAWKTETGADFDLNIAEELMTAAVRDLVVRGPRTRKALLINLGDYFHFDNMSHRTTKGQHMLDVDGRTAKVHLIGVRIFTAMIDALLEHHGEVEVDCQTGNHDEYTAIMLAICLASYYRNEPRVYIPMSPSNRHYHRFGKVLIGTTHGDRGKMDDLGEIMAAERPEDWGATKFRYWLCGHVHHQSVKEYRGCKVETFRTLAGRDSWHAAQGYLAGRDMQRLTYHKDFGEIAREVANVDYLQASGR